MRRLIAACVIASVCLPAVVVAVGGKDAVYVGGTIPGLSENVEGKLDTTNDTMLTFIPKKKGAAPVQVPYAGITELEYGQKAGRRVGVAIMVSPLALFSKKRKHYLTITYTDAQQKEQAGVFELGKDIVRTTLKIVETRSGKDITFQDDEAKRSIGGGKGQ